MTEDDFEEGFARLTAAFPSHEVTGATAAVWFKLLEPMPTQLFLAGVQHVISTHRFHTFPTPAQVLEVLEWDQTYAGKVTARGGSTAAVKLDRYRDDMKRGLLPGAGAQELKLLPPSPEDRERFHRGMSVVMDVAQGKLSVEDALKKLEDKG